MAKRKMTEAQLANLQIDKYKFSKDNPEIAQICQEKSVAARRKNTQNKKLLQEICNIVGEQTDENTGDSNKVAMVKALYEKAKSGDVNAFNTLRDTMGEKPVDKQEIKTNQPAVLSEYSEKKIEEVLQRIKKTTYE